MRSPAAVPADSSGALTLCILPQPDGQQAQCQHQQQQQQRRRRAAAASGAVPPALHSPLTARPPPDDASSGYGSPDSVTMEMR